MDLGKKIKDAVKEGKAILGYNRVIKEIKTGRPEVIVYSNNIPKDKLENIIHNTKKSNIKVEPYSGNNVDLGLFCGKPFSVSVLAIKGSEK